MLPKRTAEVNRMFSERRYREAQVLLEELVVEAPEEWLLLSALVSAHWYLGERDTARAKAEEALRRRPGEPRLRVVLGRIQSELGELEAAAATLEAALALDEGMAEGHEWLARTRLRAGQLERALESIAAGLRHLSFQVALAGDNDRENPMVLFTPAPESAWMAHALMAAEWLARRDGVSSFSWSDRPPAERVGELADHAALSWVDEPDGASGVRRRYLGNFFGLFRVALAMQQHNRPWQELHGLRSEVLTALGREAEAQRCVEAVREVMEEVHVQRVP